MAIITQAEFDKIVASGKYNDNGLVHSDGYEWHCTDDCTAQETHHLRLGRI